MILEFMPGGSLQSHIEKTKKERFKWSHRFQLMLDICEGMAYLHSPIDEADGSEKPRVYHQDLKSANVLLMTSQDGELRGKISDFGLAGMFATPPNNAEHLRMWNLAPALPFQ
jgi:serine/threonine protein kinase